MARKLACLDASVLVALVYLGDMHREGAYRVCIAARRAGYRLITSHLAIAEMYAVIRRKKAASIRCRTGSEKERAAAGAEVEATVDSARELLDKLSGNGIIEIMDAEDWPPRLALAGRKALEHAGRVLAVVAGRMFRHRGIGSCDWLHFLLALHLGAQVICTADKAFADVHGNDDEFGHIWVQLTSGPLVGPLAG